MIKPCPRQPGDSSNAKKNSCSKPSISCADSIAVVVRELGGHGMIMSCKKISRWAPQAQSLL